MPPMTDRIKDSRITFMALDRILNASRRDKEETRREGSGCDSNRKILCKALQEILNIDYVVSFNLTNY